ncbi:MAG TPA: N-acetyltransferase [Cyanothece sp. UBA12306]|nr:N-acetyltransferase [Cyanothece sp. UBA12306]
MEQIRLANNQDLLEINQLIKTIFKRENITKITAQGHDNFLHFISYDSLSKRISVGSKIWLYKINSELVGVLEINRENHIFLYFVKKKYRGRKIGKALFNYVKTQISGDITANSSDYALPIYQKLGFIQTGIPKNQGGIIVSPVLYKN